jgi:hypothetical protein
LRGRAGAHGIRFARARLRSVACQAVGELTPE